MNRPKWKSDKKREIKEQLTGGYYQCRMCKKVVENVDLLAIEHKIPLSKGGNNEMENLTVLCKSCNSKRKNRVGDEHFDSILSGVKKELIRTNVDLINYEKEIGTLTNEVVADKLSDLKVLIAQYESYIQTNVLNK